MMKTRCLFISFLMLLTLSATAQKRRAAKPKLTPEQIERQAKLERMTENTQRIVFIDSMVIPKKQFLSAYLLSPEVGQVARHQDIFHTQQQPDAFVHVNDLGTRCYLSLAPTDTTMQLYMSDYLDEHWSRPQLLKGINDDNQFQRVNYPFMMGDGQTFYFAAEGGDGLGGYDIYVTRYDAEEGQFLHPVNIGMPFNSEANDYLYIIDEYSNLGWFATDRNQPADTVCVYLFLPPVTRQTYSASGLTLEEIAPYARIDRIEDTWTDEAPRQEAMEGSTTSSSGSSRSPWSASLPLSSTTTLPILALPTSAPQAATGCSRSYSVCANSSSSNSKPYTRLATIMHRLVQTSATSCVQKYWPVNRHNSSCCARFTRQRRLSAITKYYF